MTEQSRPLQPGDVLWADLEPVRGREQGGRRPVLVVSGAGYLRAVTTLVWIVPVTTSDRALPNHVRLGGASDLPSPSWAMTEQLRTISRQRLKHRTGRVDASTLATVQQWLSDFLDLPILR